MQTMTRTIDIFVKPKYNSLKNKRKGAIVMAKANVNIEMDADLKEKFEEFCDDMGLDMNTAFNIFAKKVVNEYRIPFEIGYPKPNAETLEAMQEVEEMKANSSLGKRYTDVEEMMRDILK